MEQERKGEPADGDFKQWFERISERVLALASQIIFDKGEMHAPMLLVFNKGSTDMIPLLLDFSTLQCKSIEAAKHRYVASQTDLCDGAIMVTEAWTLALEKGKRRKDYPDSLEHAQGRREMLMFSAMRGRMQLLALYEINRKTKQFENRQLVDPTDEHSTGRMILNRPTKH